MRPPLPLALSLALSLALAKPDARAIAAPCARRRADLPTTRWGGRKQQSCAARAPMQGERRRLALSSAVICRCERRTTDAATSATRPSPSRGRRGRHRRRRSWVDLMPAMAAAAQHHRRRRRLWRGAAMRRARQACHPHPPWEARLAVATHGTAQRRLHLVARLQCNPAPPAR